MNGRQRGVISKDELARQLILFEGMVYYDTMSPTDIDGFMEFQDKAFLFFEIKLKGVELMKGQKLALERLCMSLNKPAIVFYAEHQTPPEEDIIARDTMVVRYFWECRWHDLERPVRLGDAVGSFLERYHD